MVKDKFSIVRQIIWMKWFHTNEHNQKQTKRFIKCMHWLMLLYSISWKFLCIFCVKVETNKAIIWKMKIVKWFRNRYMKECVRVCQCEIQKLFISVLGVLSKLYSHWICCRTYHWTRYTHHHHHHLYCVQ